jgi:ATP-dependent Lhr-like helicase
MSGLLFVMGKVDLSTPQQVLVKHTQHFLGLLIEEINSPDYRKNLKKFQNAHDPQALKKPTRRKAPDTSPPIKMLWITPLRALANDTLRSIRTAVDELCPWFSVELRTGDSSQSTRKRQAEKLPTIFITTPESLSLMISYPGFEERFRSLKVVVVDEWHELIGSKRGVLTELGLARIRTVTKDIRLWGVSATLGNTKKALEVLLGRWSEEAVMIGSGKGKNIEIVTLLPEIIERFPWAGHLGITMLNPVIDIIESSNSTLLFTNTRYQAEIWYHKILDEKIEWAGILGLHHGSMDKESRTAVEQLLSKGKMKCVVCTSSLDLGVDFSPVDTVIQIGSPKGIATIDADEQVDRDTSREQKVRLYCVPTNSFELVEFSAARSGIEKGKIEPRTPIEKPLDVLAQHIVTVATGEGFRSDDLFEEVKTTHSFRNLSEQEWEWTMEFVIKGGKALKAYPEYSKIRNEEGFYVVENETLRRRHRMSIGTITSETEVIVKFMNGGSLGTLEENFVSRLKPGDSFIFSGRVLEYHKLVDMVLYVKKSDKKNGPVPQWGGGRMPLSTELAGEVRIKLREFQTAGNPGIEMSAISPLLDLQQKWSVIPMEDELLIEKKKTTEGFHLFIYPFEGKLVHEGLSALLAYRLSQIQSATFSISTNDYGFEILSTQEYELDNEQLEWLFAKENIVEDVLEVTNSTEMAQRKFRDIARIAGLVFQGYPGSSKKPKQLQASGALLFEVLSKYDPGNLLIKQAEMEVLETQLEVSRLMDAMKRMRESRKSIIDVPFITPMAFPLMVNRMREKLTSEKLSDRIAKLIANLENAAEKEDFS